MELSQLESLVAIADTGSAGRAALALNLTRPSPSRRVARREEELGQRRPVRTVPPESALAAGIRPLVIRIAAPHR